MRKHKKYLQYLQCLNVDLLNIQIRVKSKGMRYYLNNLQGEKGEQCFKPSKKTDIKKESKSGSIPSLRSTQSSFLYKSVRELFNEKFSNGPTKL